MGAYDELEDRVVDGMRLLIGVGVKRMTFTLHGLTLLIVPRFHDLCQRRRWWRGALQPAVLCMED